VGKVLDELIARYERLFSRHGAKEHKFILSALELSKAQAEGRLVVLPCKVSDTGWQIIECFDGDRGCHGMCDECPKKKTVVSFRFISKAHIVRHIEKGDFGKTVFLTREEAESEGLR
jgi:hypothetical protein